MKKLVLYRMLCLCGVGLILGLSSCGMDANETDAPIIETRAPEEIEQMKIAATAKEEAKADAIIYRARPYQVEAEDMQRWAEALFEGNEAYAPRVVYENRDEADRINDLKWIKSDWEFHEGGYYSWTTDSYGNPEGSYITRCLHLETQLGDELGRLRWNEIEGEQGSLRFDRFEEYTDKGAPAWPDENQMIGEEVENSNTISLGEAEDMGYELLASMGLEDYVLIDSSQVRDQYNLSYAKTYDGKRMIPENWNSFLAGDDEEKIYYCCESLGIKIVDDEIKLFNWENPLEIIEEESFFLSDDMCLQLTQQYREDLNGYILGLPSEAERLAGVEERMFRIQSMNHDEEFWIVPCWKKK